jgi:signal transduction histidine kinase
MIKAVSLRTQLALAAGFFLVLTLGTSVALWLQTRSEAEVRAAADRELLATGELALLRGSLRHLDGLADNYLLSGDPAWLARREPVLAHIKEIRLDLRRLIPEQPDPAASAEFELRLADYLARQEAGLAEMRAGRLTRAAAAKLARDKAPLADLLGAATRLRQAHIGEMRSHQRAMQGLFRGPVFLLLLTDLAACALLAWALTLFFAAPIQDLQRYARSWSLGRPWTHVAARASQEVRILVSCMRDMAEQANRRYAQEQELGRLKAGLVSFISHEFNNALTIMRNCTFLLEESERGPVEMSKEELFQMLNANIRSLSDSTTNILNMARIENGRFAVDPRRVDLSDILRESLTRLELLSSRKRQTVSLLLPERPLLVKADAHSMSLVFTNLLSNAIKYTPEEGRVTLGAELLPEAPGRARFYVQDTGIGISAEDQTRIFEGYYRTEAGRRSAKGFGIGLSLAKQVVEAHGSELLIDSRPGAGSRFHFTLPLWQPQDGPPPA